MQPAPPRIIALPCWVGTPLAEPMAGGLSNEIWKVEDEAGTHVVRFGEDIPAHHVFRAREREVAQAAHRAGFAPAVEWTGGDAMVTAFVASTAWDAARVRAEPGRVGHLLREFHDRMGREATGAPALFDPHLVARDYARTIRGGAHGRHLPRLMALTDALEAAQPPVRLVFGHNDLLPANILDDGARLWLIDFEYAAWASPLFDLAGAASNAGMTPDESDALLAAYFGEAVAPERRRAFDAMTISSLLRETMWAMVSSLHLKAPGVDYDAYAADNLARLEAALDAYETRHGSLTR